jgi:hypothetical protein
LGHLAPIRISMSKTLDGRILAPTISKMLLENDDFRLNVSKHIYIRIVPDGLLITHHERRGEAPGAWIV